VNLSNPLGQLGLVVQLDQVGQQDKYGICARYRLELETILLASHLDLWYRVNLADHLYLGNLVNQAVPSGSCLQDYKYKWDPLELTVQILVLLRWAQVGAQQLTLEPVFQQQPEPPLQQQLQQLRQRWCRLGADYVGPSVEALGFGSKVLLPSP
jgi:hypothetical protein